MGLDVELISPKQARQMSRPLCAARASRGPHQGRRQCRKALVLALRPAVFDRDVAALHEAVFTQTLMERRRAASEYHLATRHRGTQLPALRAAGLAHRADTSPHCRLRSRLRSDSGELGKIYPVLVQQIERQEHEQTFLWPPRAHMVHQPRFCCVSCSLKAQR